MLIAQQGGGVGKDIRSRKDHYREGGGKEVCSIYRRDVNAWGFKEKGTFWNCWGKWVGNVWSCSEDRGIKGKEGKNL